MYLISVQGHRSNSCQASCQEGASPFWPPHITSYRFLTQLAVPGEEPLQWFQPAPQWLWDTRCCSWLPSWGSGKVYLQDTLLMNMAPLSLSGFHIPRSLYKKETVVGHWKPQRRQGTFTKEGCARFLSRDSELPHDIQPLDSVSPSSPRMVS